MLDVAKSSIISIACHSLFSAVSFVAFDFSWNKHALLTDQTHDGLRFLIHGLVCYMAQVLDVMCFLTNNTQQYLDCTETGC